MATKKIESKQRSSKTKHSEIRELIDFIAHSKLNEVSIETKELKLFVKREPDQKVSTQAQPVLAAPPPPTLIAAAPSVAKPIEVALPKAYSFVDIKSPMIGSFYRSKGTESPPFVSVGDIVSKGQVVCINEAMKLFNEIESEVSGTITKVMVENASPVEFDQVLFQVEPD